LILGPGGTIDDYPGLQNVPPDLRVGLTNFSISGLGSPNYGVVRTYTPQNVYQLNDRINWIRGKHTIGFGAAIRKNEEYDATGATDLSSWLFAGTYTAIPYQSASTNYDTGYADFLLGLANQLTTGGFSEKGPWLAWLASLRRCGHTTGRRFWDGLDTGSIAWTLTSMARS
jgi:hypothetical protein